jgi:uncharacterized protein YfiM (DUF2279 family)
MSIPSAFLGMACAALAAWPLAAARAISDQTSARVPLLSLQVPDDRVQRERVVMQRNLWLLGGSTTALLAYGNSRWWADGFQSRFKNEREGWFSRSAEFGGIDKIGHAFSNYAGVRLLAPMLEAVGNEREPALRMTLWATLGTFTAVEVLDGYSRSYSFSREDFWSNIAGAAAGVLFERNPRLDQLIDLRFGYRRDAGSKDGNVFGDYEGQRFLMVVKADGIPALRANTWTRHLEFSVGHGIRGFEPGGPSQQRQFERFVGISINLSTLLADAAYGGARGSTRTQRSLERGFELFQLAPGAWHTTLY